MLARPLRFPEERAVLLHDGWVYERKLDGLRCVAVRHGDRVDLWSRNHLSFNRRFPRIAEAMLSLPLDSFSFDGEIVAFSGERTSFELLHEGGADVRTEMVVFDLLHLLGRDTTVLALTERAGLLRRALTPAPAGLSLSVHLTGDPGSLLASACAAGWEGLVAKRVDSLYRPGRSGDWRKLKCTARQELVVGGWTDPSGARTGFGALLVGYYDGDRLRYAGKVGTGFDENTLRSLLTTMRAMEAENPPFYDLARMKGAHWCRPQLVAEIAFTEWTREGRLRHPSFLGLRPDKAARDVTRER